MHVMFYSWTSRKQSASLAIILQAPPLQHMYSSFLLWIKKDLNKSITTGCFQ